MNRRGATAVGAGDPSARALISSASVTAAVRHIGVLKLVLPRPLDESCYARGEDQHADLIASTASLANANLAALTISFNRTSGPDFVGLDFATAPITFTLLTS